VELNVAEQAPPSGVSCNLDGPMAPREEHATPRPTLNAPESISPEISSARCRRSPRKALAWADTSKTGCRPDAYATTHRTNTRPWNLIWN